MSELKEIGIRWEENGELHFSHVYLKSEADKVIAEKDAEIARLNDKLRHYPMMAALIESGNKEIAELKADYKAACDRLQTANLIKDEQLAATRHQKYKRCLLMTELCEERSARYDELQERTGFSWRREIDFYFRWSQHWLELAEKFKEADDGND